MKKFIENQPIRTALINSNDPHLKILANLLTEKQLNRAKLLMETGLLDRIREITRS